MQMHRKRKFKRAASGDDYALEKQGSGEGGGRNKVSESPHLSFYYVFVTKHIYF